MYESALNFIQNNTDKIIQLIIHLLILTIGIKFINSIAAGLRAKIKKEHAQSPKLHLVFVSSRFAKILLLIIIVASYLQTNGYSLTSLMTGLGITGLAIGFAAKESLSCILGSFSIMLDNIYKIGDYVEINGYCGVVETINFRSTKLRAANNTLITIPNNIPADTIVQNRSDAKFFRLIQNIEVEYGTDKEKLQLAIKLTEELCRQDKNIQNDFNVFVSELAENSITLQLIANSTTNDWIKFLEIKSNLNKGLLSAFSENNINFAFPSKTVYLRHED